jgi:hypothetical protein
MGAVVEARPPTAEHEVVSALDEVIKNNKKTSHISDMLPMQWALRHSAPSLARMSARRHNFVRCMSGVAPPTPPSAQADLSDEAARHAKGTIDVVVPTPTRPVKIKYRPVRVEPPKNDVPRDNEEPKTDDEDQPQAPPAADTWFTFVRRHLMTLGFSMLISTQLGVVFTWSNEASRLIGIDGEFDLYMGTLSRIAHSRSTMLSLPVANHVSWQRHSLASPCSPFPFPFPLLQKNCFPKNPTWWKWYAIAFAAPRPTMVRIQRACFSSQSLHSDTHGTPHHFLSMLAHAPPTPHQTRRGAAL